MSLDSRNGSMPSSVLLLFDSEFPVFPDELSAQVMIHCQHEKWVYLCIYYRHMGFC